MIQVGDCPIMKDINQNNVKFIWLNILCDNPKSSRCSVFAQHHGESLPVNLFLQMNQEQDRHHSLCAQVVYKQYLQIFM